jgi:ribonuclease HII
MAVIEPSLRWERPLWRSGATRVAGVDEVGVAPTCGAVVAAAVVMPRYCHRIPGVRDSKTLSAAQRERLAPVIRRRAVAVGVGAASVGDIDRLNIYHATHLAMRRAIARLGGHDHVLVDGLRIADFESQVGPYTAIVDGDARVYSIACASVIAKTVRDRMMRQLAARYPGYGWDRNAGYATREHRAAIREHGLTPHHRRSFQALQLLLAGDQLELFQHDPTAAAQPAALEANNEAGPIVTPIAGSTTDAALEADELVASPRR